MRVFARSLLVSLALLAATLSPAAQATDARTLWRLLDYMAVDYRGAVVDGQVVNEGEYAEMVEFSNTVATGLQALPQTELSEALQQGAVQLQTAVAAHADADSVATLARGLAATLLQAHPMPLAPAQLPDLAQGAALYAQQCVACHGAGGAGDGPAAPGMDPAPIDFTDVERAHERSVFALYQVITQGLEGTTMLSYEHLPEADRWALAFYIGSIAYPEALAVQGARRWQQDTALHSKLAGLQPLVSITPAALAAEVGEEDAAALTAYLRRSPQAVLPTSEGSLQLTRERLAASNAAYQQGQLKEAASLALSAYLDGFEPVEPLLSAKDAALMSRIEGQMAELRARIGRNAPAAQVSAQIEILQGSFAEAETVLDGEQAGAVATFLGAFTILLREGLEALLVVIAMIAFLRKADRVEVLPYVHAGWIGALVAGVATWFVATYLVSISGASRELTEGFASLFAAIVLLFVGIWMHGKSQAGAWQRYIKEKLGAALSKRSAWFLLLLVFVVVYREVFETILFYAALWSQGHGQAIVAGGVVAALLLVVIAWVMLRFSRTLPISQFFALSSLLIAVLAVVLAGKGVAALQEAGVIGTITLNLPKFDWMGFYPTVQGVGAQLATLLLVVAGFLWNRRAAPRAN